MSSIDRLQHVPPAPLTTSPGSVVEAVRESMARHAGRVAIRHAAGALSYGELEVATRRAAGALAESGVRAGDRVALILDRQVEAISAMLGAHSLGAAYVAIAPNTPLERVRVMLTELGVRCCVALEAAPVRELTAALAIPTLAPEQLALAPLHAGAPSYGPEQIAYVLHTSGSTGTPKAVANSHAGLLHRLQWMQHELAITEHDVIVQKTPFIFDVSVWEVFLPLVAGATLLLAKPGGHTDPWYLGSLLERGVTCMHFVPSMLDAFLSASVVKAPPALRHLICSGEALEADLIRRARRVFPNVGLHNYYGPTEAAIDVTRWRVEDAQLTPQARVPIGAPPEGVDVYVVGDAGERLPPGTEGELCLGGIQVAYGYLNSASATAARFLPDPFSQTPGARMYATGDYGRVRNDGLHDFLGRKDGQVKIRGMRVELEEIERTIRRRCDIARCAVVADAHCVYLLLSRDDAPRYRPELLSKELPEHMVPRRVVPVSALPVTTTGKLDRKAALSLAHASLGAAQ